MRRPSAPRRSAFATLLAVGAAPLAALLAAPLAALLAAPLAPQPAGCPSAAQPYFEFQVDQAAAFVPDSTLGLRPTPPGAAAAPPPGPNELPIVQFVVDTAGVPDVRTFRHLAGSVPVAEATRSLLARWRFTAARVNGCAVSQLVQTAVVPGAAARVRRGAVGRQPAGAQTEHAYDPTTGTMREVLRIEMVPDEAPLPAGATDRQRAVSPPGFRIVTTSWQALAERPAAWPAGLPFLAGREAETQDSDRPDEGRRRRASWRFDDAAAQLAAFDAIVAASVADGWTRQPPSPDDVAPVPDYLIVRFTRDGQMRRLIRQINSLGQPMLEVMERADPPPSGRGPSRPPGDRTEAPAHAAPSAQAAAAPQLLTIPAEQSLTCAVPSPKSVDRPDWRRLVVREFTVAARRGAAPALELPGTGTSIAIPGLDDREILAGWDSTGQPRMLVEFIAPLLRDHETLMLQFHRDGSIQLAGRSTLKVDSARMAAVLASGDTSQFAERARATVGESVTRELTTDEVERGRALLAWLWARRCGGAG